MAYKGFINISFVHVQVGLLGRFLGCLLIYVPYLLGIYKSRNSWDDLQKTR